jgi:acyl dehydratase
MISAGPLRITEEEIIKFARRFDPQWFHVDPERAARGRWNGIIASGWHSCAIAMRLACDAALTGSESFGSPGLSYLKWTAPVRPGDELSLRCEVLELRKSQSNPLLGILRWNWRLSSQLDQEVLSLEAVSLFDLDSKPT